MSNKDNEKDYTYVGKDTKNIKSSLSNCSRVINLIIIYTLIILSIIFFFIYIYINEKDKQSFKKYY